MKQMTNRRNLQHLERIKTRIIRLNRWLNYSFLFFFTRILLLLLFTMTSPENIKTTVSPLSDSSNKLINAMKTHVKTVTEMATNRNLQNENVKKEVSKVQSKAESTLITFRGEVKELRKTVTSQEKKIGLLEESLLAPILLRSLRDE